MSLWSNVVFSSDQFPRGRYLTGLAIPPDARRDRRKAIPGAEAIVSSKAMPASQASSAGQAPSPSSRFPLLPRLVRLTLGGCLAASFALPAWAKYSVDIDAPRSVRKLLEQHLDVSRFAKRDDISDDQFEFLITATPQQVRDLTATEGYFSPVVSTDVRNRDGKRSVTVKVDPGPQTDVAGVDLQFKGPVGTEDPKQETAARLAFSLHEGDAFTQSGWDGAKNAALKQLQSYRYLGAKIVSSQARIDPRTRTAKLAVSFDSGPTFTMGALDVSGVRRYPEKIVTNVNPLGVGEIYDVQRINELQRQLQNTPYLRERGDRRRRRHQQARGHAGPREGQRVSLQQRARRGRLRDRYRAACPGLLYLSRHLRRGLAAAGVGAHRPDPAIRAGPALDAAEPARLDQQRAGLVHQHQRVGRAHLQRAWACSAPRPARTSTIPTRSCSTRTG